MCEAHKHFIDSSDIHASIKKVSLALNQSLVLFYFPISLQLVLPSVSAHSPMLWGHVTRYFYNSTSGQCEQFIYGGCHGNGNNFETQESCIAQCICECSPYSSLHSAGSCWYMCMYSALTCASTHTHTHTHSD